VLTAAVPCAAVSLIAGSAARLCPGAHV
jgi:hypothetical protein